MLRPIRAGQALPLLAVGSSFIYAHVAVLVPSCTNHFLSQIRDRISSRIGAQGLHRAVEGLSCASDITARQMLINPFDSPDAACETVKDARLPGAVMVALAVTCSGQPLLRAGGLIGEEGKLEKNGAW